MRRSLLGITHTKHIKFKIKKSILLAILSLIFVFLGGSNVSALDLSQESIEVTGQSPSTRVISEGYGNLSITPELEFTRLNDFITYKLVIKNNDGKRYKILGITDDNSNDAISLSYTYPTDMDTNNKAISFTVRYVKIATAPLNPIHVDIKIVDEDDASQIIPIVIPNTGVNTGLDTASAATVQSIIIYIAFAGICFAIYIIVKRRKNKEDKEAKLGVPKTMLVLALLLGIVPVAVIAASFETIYFTVNLSKVVLDGPFEVTFDTDEGGTPIPPQIVNKGDTITPPATTPERKGYDFAGWVDGNGDPFVFTDPVTGPVTVKAAWTLKNYTISIDLAGGTAGTPANPTSYTIVTPDFTLTSPTKDHYDFAGWTSTSDNITTPTKTIEIKQGSTGNRDYTANWTEKEYTVTFDADNGTTNTEQKVKYQQTATEPTDAPTKNGYTFKGWQLNGADYDFATEVTGDITLTANWEIINYTIRYDLGDDAVVDPGNPTSYNILSATITLDPPTWTGHVFKGWTDASGQNPQKVVTIQQGSTGDLHFFAHWNDLATVIFDVNDGNPLDPFEREVEIGAQIGALPTPTRRGYALDGWYVAGTKIDDTYQVNGDVTVTAEWTAIEYDITYDLDEPTVVPTNPVKYTVADTIVLNNPEKTGYRFLGWTGSNGATPQTTVTISNSIDDLNYTANWELIEYTINYEGLEGATVNPANTATYTIKSDTITLNDATKPGYTFDGWTGEGITTPTKGVTISSGSTGNRTYTANWTINTYNIIYNEIEGATVDPANKTTYDVNTETFTLTQPTKSGYTFAGWIGSNGSTPEIQVTISKGTTGDLEYTAIWTIIPYTINYAGLEDATVDPANKTTYDVKTETFTLTEPTKRGYTFTGWTSSSDGITTPTKSITIAKGSIGDRDYTANWVLTVFTITYDLDGGNVATANPTEYTMKTETFEISNEPTKDGTYAFGMDKYEFIGWTGTELSGPTKPVTIVKGSVGDRSYKANYKHSFKVLFTPGDHGTITEFDRWVEENTAVGAFPTVTVNPGYRFVGWYNSLDSTQTIVDGTYNVTTAVGFTAKYEVIDYTISLNPNGGSYKGSTSAYTVGTYNIAGPSLVTVWEPSATDLGPTREGYRFTGWTGEGITTPTLGKVELTVSAGTLGDKTYTANWVKQWTVTFESEGSVVTTEKVDDGAAVTRPADPTKTNYVLRAWQLGGVDYDFSTPVTGNITLVADWQVARSTLNFNGPTMGTKMKQLVNPSVTNGYTANDTRTKAFARATEDDYNAAVQAGLTIEVISTDSSIVDIFMWFDSTTGTINYYTEAAKVYVSGSMEKMFAKFDNLTDLSGLKDFDVSGVTDMNRLFQNCKSLNDTSLASLADWDTTNVINMTFIFGASESTYKNKITKLDSLSKWNVSNVRSFYQAFKECTELTDISGIKDWVVSSVGYYDDSGFTNASDNFGFQQMFNKCSKLADASAISGWDINYAVTSFYEAGLAGKKIGSTTLSKNSGFVNILGNNTVIVNKPSFSEYEPGGRWDGGSYVPNTPPATP